MLTVTRCPARLNAMAAVSPPRPAPTMTKCSCRPVTWPGASVSSSAAHMVQWELFLDYLKSAPNFRIGAMVLSSSCYRLAICH